MPNFNVLLAFNAFKDNCSSTSACSTAARGVLKAVPHAVTTCLPLADGGDGTAIVLAQALNAIARKTPTCDALRRPHSAQYYACDNNDTTVIESAAIVGLSMLDVCNRRTVQCSTLGVGEILKSIVLQTEILPEHTEKKKILRPPRVIVCVGGTATNDAGAGMAYALGYRFFNESMQSVEPIGGNLHTIRHIKAPSNDDIAFQKILSMDIVALVDVTNPLLGSNGATHTYGVQKGANQDELQILEQGLTRCSSGSGAGGGLAAGLVAFCGAHIESGFDFVSDLTHLEKCIENSDLVLTGEGRFDETSTAGKVPGGVAALCSRHHVPCVVLAGSIDDAINQNPPDGVTAAFSLAPAPITEEKSKRHSERFLECASANTARLAYAMQCKQ